MKTLTYYHAKLNDWALKQTLVYKLPSKTGTVYIIYSCYNVLEIWSKTTRLPGWGEHTILVPKLRSSDWLMCSELGYTAPGKKYTGALGTFNLKMQTSALKN